MSDSQDSAQNDIHSPFQDEYGSRENRLPALMEVLNRRTLPPVDLFSFYIYMRDQQRSVDYLDFWLDVSQHLSLCRHYVREMRRSVLLETPELEKAAASKRSSEIPEHLLAEENSLYSRMSEDQRVSQYLRDGASRRSEKDSSTPHTSQPRTPSERRPRSFLSAQENRDSSSQDDSSPGHSVTREDIRASAEKILYTFLLQGAEREIILPPGILQDITDAIEDQGRDDPEVFEAAKDYVFQAMERDAFPGFLRSKALGNLVPPSLMTRLIVGLLAVFGGFWAAFVLVFLDASRSTRAWITLPFTVGVYSLASHQYTIDPLLALAGYSEYTFFSFSAVREPFVRKLLVQRGLVLSAAIALITAAVVCLFVFVPGKHL